MPKISLKKGYIEEQKLILNRYLPYIKISIILGIVVKFKLFDKTFLLIDSFVNILNESPYDHSYLFSTSAAILTTVLTIIFVLLTVFIQMSGKYTASDIFQSDETKILMALYLGTVILSLMMLETTCRFPTLILTLTFVCILSIYPFLENFSSKFVYEVGLDNSLKRIPSLIISDNETSTISELKRLGEVSIRVIKEDRLQYFFEIIKFYTNIREAKQKQMTGAVEAFGDQYLYLLTFLVKNNSITDNKKKMFKLLIRQIQDYMSNYSYMIKCETLELQMYLLKEIGIDMISSSFDNRSIEKVVITLKNSLNNIRNIETSDYSKEKLEKSLVEYIGELAEELFNNQKKSPFTISLVSLWEIGLELYKENEKSNTPDSSLLFTVIKQIYELEELIGNINFEKQIEHFKLQFSDESGIENINSEFKKYYDEIKVMTTITDTRID